MSTISSPGLASGIDIKSIVSQLVALDRAPLQPLQKSATSMQSQLSIYGTLKSMMSGFGDAAAKLSDPAGWNSVKASTSNDKAVTVSTSAGSSATSLSIEVQKLAKAQSAATALPPFALQSALGAGTLSIQVGSGAAVDVVIEAGKDSLADVARTINDAKAGVSATVVRDASGERLLMRATDTGISKSFTVAVSGGSPGLERLAFGPLVTGGMTQTQAPQDAEATINNVAITSPSNRLTDTVPGLTLTLTQVTTEPVEIAVAADQEAMKKNVQSFVDAYNALNDLLTVATKYNPTTKTAGSLQGDSTAVGLQNAMRGMMRSVTASSPFSRLIDVGIEAQKDGKLEIKADKLSSALGNVDGLRALFSTSSTDPTAQGFGLKIKAFADGMVAASGSLSTRTDSLQNAIRRNTKEQERVIERAARSETRYLAQYNAMDAAVGRLNGLSSFVNQQVTLWNKSTG
ncbi:MULTISPECIES: flagellar filament capping protein FliD [Comamonadaceae]|uniref:flagellar filament capping protein FliD n=1 Tax=Comamonadaceae TaxID=80864 RepID=UPI0025C12014|nr:MULTISPECIES: flagellar filament capping protein FliD [Comamonadaceae]